LERLGFCIGRPEGWHLLTDDEFARAIAQVGPSAIKTHMEKRLAQGTASPLLSFTKYPTTYRNVNPTVQFRVIPKPQHLNVEEVLDVGLKQLMSRLEDATIATPATTITVRGGSGTMARVNYTLVMRGEKRELQTALAIFPSGEFLLQAAGIALQNAPATLRKEVESAMLDVAFMTPR
jgi:hypothetical protein